MEPDVPAKRIEVNGKAVDTAAANLDDLVREHAQPGVKVATARNGAFVPAGARAATALEPGDRIEIVSPRQGG